MPAISTKKFVSKSNNVNSGAKVTKYELLDDKAIVTWNEPVPGYDNIVTKKTMEIPKQLIVDMYNKYIKLTEEGNRDET